MFCHKCGNKIKNETIMFCTQCGAPVQREESIKEQSTQPQIIYVEEQIVENKTTKKVSKKSGLLSGVITMCKYALWILIIALAMPSLDTVYEDYLIKNASDLSTAGVDDLEPGKYVSGTIYKVMSKVGEFDGETYFTVMLPSTDDRVEDRKAMMVSTKNEELIKVFERMVYDNEHRITSKYINGSMAYTSTFKVESGMNADLRNAFENAAIGQDETLLGFGRSGLTQGNLCYYRLSADIKVPSGTKVVLSYIIVIAAGILILREVFDKLSRFMIKKSR